MSPEELKQANIEHFQRLLASETDVEKRRMIERLVDEERQKPDSAYPVQTPRPPG